MQAPSTTDRNIANLLQDLHTVTSLYWTDLRNKRVSGEVSVRWDSDVTTRDRLTQLQLKLLDCLKQFEGCFIEYRGLDIQNILVFEGLAEKLKAGYRRSTLQNADHLIALSDRHCKFAFELNHTQISYTNKDYLPILSIVALVGVVS
jgi:hypothetical protein